MLLTVVKPSNDNIIENTIAMHNIILFRYFFFHCCCLHFFSISLSFFLQIKNYEKTECHEERRKLAREIYDNFIMKEMLSHTHVSNQRFNVHKLYVFIIPLDFAIGFSIRFSTNDADAFDYYVLAFVWTNKFVILEGLA